MANINEPFNQGNDAIKLVDNDGSMILEAKRKVVKEESEPEASKVITKSKKSSLQLREEFINEIKNEEKNINEQIFKECF